jgi:hypothetical protein
VILTSGYNQSVELAAIYESSIHTGTTVVKENITQTILDMSSGIIISSW